MAESEAFRHQLDKNSWNYHFVEEILVNEIAGKFNFGFFACAYFEAQGTLLGLFGQPEYIAELRENGICEGTVWRREYMGSNAVTVGLEEQKELRVSSGAGNHLAALLEYTVYFSAIRLLNVNLENYYNAPLKLGGIAIFVKKRAKNPLYERIAEIVTHDIGMTLNCDLQLRRQYERNQDGVIFLNSAMKEGAVIATYVNDRLFHIFGVQWENLNFCSLNQFFLPEENPSLWEIIEKKRSVQGKQITLTLRGRAVTCIITVDFWNQPGLRTSGCILCITTPQIENRKISRKIANSALLSFDDVIGESLIMENTKKRAQMFAATDSNVMLLGESGVGKDVFAQAIHNASARRDKPFIVINCGAIPRELIASELLGYDGGAFTGAKKTGNIGKFELADGGTVFLDEIGELPLDLQASLLRLVEQKQFMRIGGNRMIDVDVKIICATNADLNEMIEKKTFRADLFYRLSILTLRIPPLRERGRDVILLADHFAEKTSRRIKRKNIMRIGEETKSVLMSQPWKGNVRELQNLIEMIAQLYPESVMTPEMVAENLGTAVPLKIEATSPKTQAPAHTVRRRRAVSCEDIKQALAICGGRREETAEYLGISRKTLYRYMVKYGLCE